MFTQEGVYRRFQEHSIKYIQFKNKKNKVIKKMFRYMYDYDGNGVLDQNDFECLAVRNTIMEGKGDWDPMK